jgi:hypothetical protein
MMDKHTATEMAFKHGYEKGYEAGKEDAMKWIPSREKLPTIEDSDKYRRVLVIEHGMIDLVDYRGPHNYPDKFPYWLPLPKPPKECK